MRVLPLRPREPVRRSARFTGYQIDGGYAEYTVADQRFCFAMPAGYSDVEAAPLLCAGLIGYRSLRMAGDARRLGMYGFGAAAHIIAQVARWQGREVYAFTRPGDTEAQAFARELGAVWAGGSDQPPPRAAGRRDHLRARRARWCRPRCARSQRGGTVVCAGIHMSAIPSFPYDILWGERVVRSVANLTRRDGEEFLALAPTGAGEDTARCRTRWTRRTRRSRICVTGGCRARRCCMLTIPRVDAPMRRA